MSGKYVFASPLFRSLSQHRMRKKGRKIRRKPNHRKTSTSTRTHTDITENTVTIFERWCLWGNYICSPPLIAVSIGWITTHTAGCHTLLPQRLGSANSKNYRICRRKANWTFSWRFGCFIAILIYRRYFSTNHGAGTFAIAVFFCGSRAVTSSCVRVALYAHWFHSNWVLVKLTYVARNS